jgi:hypothetical protein
VGERTFGDWKYSKKQKPLNAYVFIAQILSTAQITNTQRIKNKKRECLQAVTNLFVYSIVMPLSVYRKMAE